MLICIQLLLYDHLLTLPDEVEHVWSAPNTLGKVLFLILRYMVPIFMLAENISACIGFSQNNLADTFPTLKRGAGCR
jgi:hypothetical protein